MPFDDLSQFLQAAADARELERVSVPLDPRLEIAAVTEQICREFDDASPALLFEHPSGSQVPVVTNLLGNRVRFLRALGAASFADAADRLVAALTPFPAAPERSFAFSPNAADRQRLAPRVVRRGLCQQVVKLGKDLNVQEFPALHCWEGESRPAITGAQLIAAGEGGLPLLESVSAEVLDTETLQLHWREDSHIIRLWKAAAAQSRQLPVALSLGGDPLLSYVASLPLPAALDPWRLAGLLRQESVNLIGARSVELNVPADAEIILEGYLDPAPGPQPGTLAARGGLLQTQTGLPHLRLSAVTHRAHPLLPSQVQSVHFSEDAVCGALTEQLLLRALRLTSSALLDLHLPRCGAGRQAVFLSIEADDPRQTDRLLHALGGLPFACAASLVVAVGPEVDLREPQSVWREVSLSAAASAFQTAPAGESRLVLNAVAAGQRQTVRRGQAGPEVLARLRQRMGISGWEGDGPADQTLDSIPSIAPSAP